MIPQFVPFWGNAEKNAVLDVLDGDYLLENKVTRKFEKQFAEFVGARHCVTCTSGTIALYMALMVDEKFCYQVPSYQGLFAANAIEMANKAKDITDVGKNGSIDKEKVSICIHANGRLGSVYKIEDCAQAINHHTKNKISCYSFASTKHLTTLGQGGAVCCDDKETFDKLTELKDQGRTDRQNLRAPSDYFDRWGTNFKFTEAQAAFGIAQLSKLPWRLDRLKKIQKIYEDILKSKAVFLPENPRWYIDMFVKNPEQVVNECNAKGFGVKRVHKPIHMQPYYKTPGDFNKSESIYASGVFLPSTTTLSDDEVIQIAEHVKQVL